MKGMIKIRLESALILFNILLLFYQIIIEVFTILCRINGMTVDKSKFQVISILTGTGFTTDESESMIITRRRRNLTQGMMMFSYIFNIIIVSTLVNLFMSTASTNFQEIKIGIILTIINLILIFIIRKSRRVKNTIDRIVVFTNDKYNANNGAIINIYDSYGDEIIAEVQLNRIKKNMDNKKLKELDLRKKYNIQILIIKRNDEIIDRIDGEQEIKEDDILIVFGRYKDIKQAFVKKSDLERMEKDK